MIPRIIRPLRPNLSGRAKFTTSAFRTPKRHTTPIHCDNFLRWRSKSTTNDLKIRCFSTIPEIGTDDVDDLSIAGERSVEEQYSRKTPLEHILLRPGMYVGPVERSSPQVCWVLDPTPEPFDFTKDTQPTKETDPSTGGLFRMTRKEYGVVPALIKIFDEILVNASDNRLRNPKTCTKLDVRIDPGSEDREPRIRIWNNGKGVPVQIHAGENMYVPEMLFGHLLTGSNFDDDEKRVTGE